MVKNRVAERTDYEEPTTESTPRVGKPKKVCPITREQFEENAKPLVCSVAGKEVLVQVKQPKEGSSLGWFGGGKIILTVDGIPWEAQVGVNVTLIGSKPGGGNGE